MKQLLLKEKKKKQFIRNASLQKHLLCQSVGSKNVIKSMTYSTVTDLARFLGWSTSVPLETAV